MIQTIQLSKEIQAGLKGIQHWMDMRAKKDAVSLINCFREDGFLSIEKADYEAWKTNRPEYIHAYPAMIEGKLHFVLIDEVSDKALKSQELENLEVIRLKAFEKSSEHRLPDLMRETKAGNIEVEEGLKRLFRWQHLRQHWLEKQLELTTSMDNGLFYLLKIPFQNFTDSFEAGYEKVFAFMALKEFKNPCGCPVDPAFYQDLQADMILFGYKDKLAEISATEGIMKELDAPMSWIFDTTAVCPPLCSGGVGGGGDDEDKDLGGGIMDLLPTH